MTQELLNKINELPQAQQEDITSIVEEYYEMYINKRRKLQAKFNKIIAEMSVCGMAIGYEGTVFDPLEAIAFMSIEQGKEYFNG